MKPGRPHLDAMEIAVGRVLVFVRLPLFQAQIRAYYLRYMYSSDMCNGEYLFFALSFLTGRPFEMREKLESGQKVVKGLSLHFLCTRAIGKVYD